MRKITLFLMSLLISVGAMAQDYEFELIDIRSNADAMLYTNAKCTDPRWGDAFTSWDVLFDNNPRTYFHTEYANNAASEDGLDHYLRVDLGEGKEISAFKFEYTTRGGDANYDFPQTIVIAGSHDGVTYTNIRTISSGLPSSAGKEYTSDVIATTQSCRYIRFMVTKTNTDRKGAGDEHNYWHMAEFALYKATEVARTEYVHNTGFLNRNDRRLNSFTLTDGKNNLNVTDIQTTSTSPVYIDKSSSKLTTTAGATLYFSDFSYTGAWMHAYAYVDYNKDYFFNLTDNNAGTNDGEIVSYNYYNGKTITGDAGDTEGNALTTSYGDSKALPAFTLPANLEPGEYRMRIKVDWDNLDADYGASDIAANGGCQCDITLVVEATVDKDQFDQYMDLATTYLAASQAGKVGYPYAGTDAFRNLNELHLSIYTNGYTDKSTYDYTVETFTELENAFNAYVNSAVKMPENGKAYIIQNVQKSGNNFMLSDEYDTPTLPAAAEKEDFSNVFICTVYGNQGYALVNAKTGKYMLFHSTSSYYPYEADGYTETFTRGEKNLLKLNSQATLLMGTISIAGKRNYDSSPYATMMIKNDGTMEGYSGEAYGTYFDTYSSLFTFEQVEYPNTVKLTLIEGDRDELISEDLHGKTIGTWSATYPAAIPLDVTAYYAENANGYIKLKPFQATDAIPANEGVILIGNSSSVSSAMMVPATDASPANLIGDNDTRLNAFSCSAGASVEIGAGDYILAKKEDQGIGFYESNPGTLAMNKAFLRLGTSGTSAFRLVVDETVTGIEGVATEKVDAPIYDLSGRRVLNTVKGGIYIQNGKKFIVK